MFCQELFQLRDLPVQIRRLDCLDRAQLHVHERRQASSDPGVNLDSVRIRDQEVKERNQRRDEARALVLLC